MLRYITGLVLLFIFFYILSAEGQPYKANTARQRWVDSVYNKLNDKERIGQLFMVAAYSGGKDYNEDKIKELLAAHQVGGLIFMQGTPEAQASLNNQYQQMAQVPLLIGMDAEWGLGMRLKGVDDLPRQMMIGATRDTALAYAIGTAIAAQCKRLGVHIDFGPVVDVNNNPNNPIINARSYGEDKKWVARLGIAYMRGLQNNGVMASAKHFPGHGDTDVDSHKDLPTINKTLKQLDTLELYPFRQLIKAGVKSIMVAHLQVPALEKKPHVPTTLSYNTITNLLKKQMGFKGLVFTDALNMQGVTKYFEPGDVDLRAFMAGNDVLLFSQDVPKAIDKMQQALDDNTIARADLEQRVKKILGAKYDAGLYAWKPVNLNNLTADLNRATTTLRARVSDAAVTMIRDRNNILAAMTKGAALQYIGVNAGDTTELFRQLSQAYGNMDAQWLTAGSSEAAYEQAAKSAANTISIVAVHNMSFYPSGGDYGLTSKQLAFLKQVQKRTNVMLVVMGNPYLLKTISDAPSIVVAYEDDSITESSVAKVLMGEMVAKGILPVTPYWNMGMEKLPVVAVKTKAAPAKDKLTKVFFAEDAGVTNSDALDKLGLFMQRNIVAGAFPGARILAAKNGKIFYDECFGFCTPDKITRVDTNTIYDVASLTKILSTTLAVMHLYETGALNLDKTIGDYLPWTRSSDKAPLKIRNLLMHQAGLKAWIPFYTETLTPQGDLRPDLYRRAPDGDFSIEVAKGVYLRKDYKDTIWNRILESPLENKGRYVYSDLDYFFLSAIVQQITGQRIDQYVEEQFYKPLNLKRISYNPLKKFRATEIAPTENDVTFRHQQLQGYVHDQAAALLGGVAGHAGIFASAGDVAAIFQMLLNGGTYNGKRLFKKATVDYFTAYHSTLSRRALGFDKPATAREDGGPAGNRVTGYAFGHQGFTGTAAWADPGTGVVFVFLSNRVDPSAENNLINKLSVRTVAQDYIYEALGLPVVRNRAEVQKEQLSAQR